MFIGPFFFLSGLGGQIADRFDKSLVARSVKLVEIAVSALGVVGFWLHSIPIMFVTLFLFGVIATLFGPIKYGILPDHLKPEELPAGNALVEGATFMAILLGTIVGGLAAKEGSHPAMFGALIMVFALLCWGSSLMIPRTGSGAPDLVSIPTSRAPPSRCSSDLWTDNRLWWGGLVTSWFWLVGAVVLSLMPPLVKNMLGGDRGSRHRLPRDLLDRDRDRLRPRRLARARPHRAAIRPSSAPSCSACSRSISAGRSMAPRPRRRPASARCSPRGRGIRVAIDLAGLAIAGGLFIVPAFAAVQAWAGADKRARVVAAVNVLNAAFMRRRHAGRRRPADIRRHAAAAVPADRRRQSRRRRR